MNNKLSDFFSKHKISTVFLLTFVAVMIYLFTVNVKSEQFVYDSEKYLELANALGTSEGNLHSSYPQDLRGVVFPLFLHFFNSIAEFFGEKQVWGWRIMISIIVAGLSVVLPRIYKPFIKKRFLTSHISFLLH